MVILVVIPTLQWARQNYLVLNYLAISGFPTFPEISQNSGGGGIFPYPLGSEITYTYPLEDLKMVNIIWGGLNGAGLVFYKLWNRISPWKDKSKWYFRAWAIFLTFTFITFTRVWFRAGSNTSWTNMEGTHDIKSEFLSATLMLERIFLHMDWSLAPKVIMGYWQVFAVILFGMIVHWLPSTFKERYRMYFANLPIPVIVLICFTTIVFVYQILSADLHPFIYFQF